MLTVVLAVAMLLVSNARIAAHDLPQLTQIVTDHHTDIAEHGHAHDEVVSAFDAYHGHGHDVADHDHNVAFLPDRKASGKMMPTRSNWRIADSALPSRCIADLDRPPRG
jgi:hypothetical protein